MNRDLKIAETMIRFLDKDYAIDNPSEGWDCLNSIYSFYSEMGVTLPTEFEEWTLQNYGKKALADPDNAHKVFERFILSLGAEINPAFMVAGDLILFVVKDFGTYAGIYVGNGNALMIFDKGSRICPLRFFASSVKSIRRLLD